MRIERAGEVQFNALGEPTRQIDAAGRVIQRGFDASGRPASVADGQGYRQVIERDSEGRTMRIGLYRPDSGADPYRATYFRRDESGRPVGQLLPDGRLLSWAYDADGQLTEQIDGDEVRHSFLRTAERTTSARLDQAPDGAVRLSGGHEGVTESQTVLRHEGRCLAEVADPAQTSRYTWDALGRHIGESVRLTGLTRILATAIRFDPVYGLPSARTLADGRVLRLPGQYYDEETGLHDNGFRTYDPATGNYLQPDPLGYPDGPDAYRYAQGDPLNKIDPTGLYQSDIHYYMTFFLSVAAGMSVEEAQVVALAAQYVDDSPDTVATAIGTTGHITRLLSYHFTPVSSSVDPATGLLLNGYSQYGNPPNNANYANQPQNAQLIRLSDAISISASEKNLANTRCTQLQFFGEYLHAFEDTFGHRDRKNLPYAINGGLGHGDDGNKPDYTYDEAYAPGGTPWPQGWYVRSARTLQMEQEVFAKLTYWGNAANAHSFAEIEQTLKEFNAIKENEGWGGGYDPEKPEKSQKIKLLQGKLKEWGVQANLLETAKQGYNKGTGAEYRNKNLCDKDKKALDQKKYPGTILPACS